MFTIAELFDDIKKGATLERIHKNYGGFNLYIPRNRADYKEKIVEEFNGYNYDTLAYKYNTTPSNVRDIINKSKNSVPSLFE